MKQSVCKLTVAFLAVFAVSLFAGCGSASTASSSAVQTQSGSSSETAASAMTGSSKDDSQPTGMTSIVTPDEKKEAAREFATKWLDDWVFENGEMQKNAQSVANRCLPLVAAGSTLYRELNDESNFVGMDGKYFHGAAFCVVGATANAEADDTYRVNVSVYGTQNTVTQEMYDKMTSDPSQLHHFILVIVVDDNGKITDLTEEKFV